MSEAREAIDAALARVYPGVTPQHWGTLARSGGGPDPLDGVRAYLVPEPLHFHFVGDGLASGWGIELTLRVAAEGDMTPPPWAIGLLQTMARYIVETRRPLGHAHYVDYGGPLSRDVPTALEALLFANDVALAPVDEVVFVQGFGLTADEYELLDYDNADKLLDLVREGNPWLITDLARPSMLLDRKAAARMRKTLKR